MASDPQGREPRAAAIEILVPAGPRFLYGLLGCHFKPDQAEHVTIQVQISSPEERIFPDSLGTQMDEVRVGLPAEYGSAVLSGVALEKDRLEMLGAGNLTFNCAAHGAVGSCTVIFKHLSAMLIKILSTVTHGLSDDEMAEMFPHTWN